MDRQNIAQRNYPTKVQLYAHQQTAVDFVLKTYGYQDTYVGKADKSTSAEGGGGNIVSKHKGVALLMEMG